MCHPKQCCVIEITESAYAKKPTCTSFDRRAPGAWTPLRVRSSSPHLHWIPVSTRAGKIPTPTEVFAVYIQFPVPPRYPTLTCAHGQCRVTIAYPVMSVPAQSPSTMHSSPNEASPLHLTSNQVRKLCLHQSNRLPHWQPPYVHSPPTWAPPPWGAAAGRLRAL